MNKSPSFSIVIPSYNEEKNISEILHSYEIFKSKYNFSLIYVNNGSTDNSQHALESFAKQKKYDFLEIVNVKKNIGYGHGIMTGVKTSKSEIIAWTHADMQTKPSDVFKAYDLYIKLSDPQILIKGKRKNRKFPESFISFFMGLIAALFLRNKLTEINAQPKLFNRNLVKELKNAPDDFNLDLFLLFKAKKLKYKIIEFDVDFLKRKHGKSKWAFSYRSRVKMILKTS